MKRLAHFSIAIFEVGDQYLAEIRHSEGFQRETVMSGNVRPHLTMSEEAVRHFTLKSFVLKIADMLRGTLEGTSI